MKASKDRRANLRQEERLHLRERKFNRSRRPKCSQTVFFIALVIVALSVVGALIAEETIATSAVTSNEQVADAARWQGMAEYYRKQAEVWSLERSQAAEDQPYIMDSATRSYIAWGEALEAAGQLGDLGTCSNSTQENIFAGIPNNLDSATRSYIAWGLALQAKDHIRACR